jgi:hypothetical protein
MAVWAGFGRGGAAGAGGGESPVEGRDGTVELGLPVGGEPPLTEQAQLHQVAALALVHGEVGGVGEVVRAGQASQAVGAGQVGAQAAPADAEVDP